MECGVFTDMGALVLKNNVSLQNSYVEYHPNVVTKGGVASRR